MGSIPVRVTKKKKEHIVLLFLFVNSVTEEGPLKLRNNLSACAPRAKTRTENNSAHSGSDSRPGQEHIVLLFCFLRTDTVNKPHFMLLFPILIMSVNYQCFSAFLLHNVVYPNSVDQAVGDYLVSGLIAFS